MCQKENYSATVEIQHGEGVFSSLSWLLDSSGKWDQGSKIALPEKTTTYISSLQNITGLNEDKFTNAFYSY